MEFKSVSNFFDESNVYVIPTFQRPYAWGEKELNDLIQDVRKGAGKKNPYHYFAPVHLLKVDIKTDAKIWVQYTDDKNVDLTSLAKSDFAAKNFKNINTYLVIDGQQRLTTLFAMLTSCLPSDSFFVTLSDGYKIPKVILNPADDHVLFRQLLGLDLPDAMKTEDSKSQKLLQNLFNFMCNQSSTLTLDQRKFIAGAGCKLLPVTLESNASLASFMTLNDRGKDLTWFEKSKSLLMEFDDSWRPNDGEGSTPSPHAINELYGAVYRSMNSEDSFLTEDEFLRQSAIRIWESTQWGGKHYDASPHDDSIENVYGRFRDFPEANLKAASTSTGERVHSLILPEMQIVVNQHNELVKFRANAKRGEKLNAPSCMPLSQSGRDAIEDYQSILNSLPLQRKQLAVLFAIRNQYDNAWHETMGTASLDNRGIKQGLRQQLAQIQSQAKSENFEQTTEFGRWFDETQSKIDNICDQQERPMTALHLVEMLRLIVGDSKPGFFTSYWEWSFRNNSKSMQDCLKGWIDYITSHGSRVGFVLEIARTPRIDNQDPRLKYLLREYEYCLPQGINAHRVQELDIEHYFPANYSSIECLSGSVFNSVNDYEAEFLNRPGNKFLLDSGLNRAIKDLSPSQKINHYRSGSYGSVVLTPDRKTQSSLQVVSDIAGVSDLGLLKWYVRFRQLQLAVFAAQRF